MLPIRAVILCDISYAPPEPCAAIAVAHFGFNILLRYSIRNTDSSSCGSTVFEKASMILTPTLVLAAAVPAFAISAERFKAPAYRCTWIYSIMSMSDLLYYNACVNLYTDISTSIVVELQTNSIR
jgi:hypothetical protein